MRYIYINQINGLYDEFYNPNPQKLNAHNVKIENHYFDINSIFWTRIFDEINIRNVISMIPDTTPVIQFSQVRANKELFIKKVNNAKYRICDQGINDKVFFENLEVLTIVSKLYEEYIFKPYKFNIQEGLNIGDFSAERLYNQALVHSQNPILSFIKEMFTYITAESPDIVFLEGKLNVSGFCIARLLKQIGSPSKVICTRHSSEYYSLNKIEHLLQNNIYLFKCIDVVILEYFAETEKQIIEGHHLDKVSNLLYVNETGEVSKTQYSPPPLNSEIQYSTREQNPTNSYRIDPSKIINIHLEPYTKCYLEQMYLLWNQPKVSS